MSSRATALPPDPKKPRTAKGLIRQKQRLENLKNRDFPSTTGWGEKAVCKRCHLIMRDIENGYGVYRHLALEHQTRAQRCPNNNQSFGWSDPEVVPFMRKGRRRYLKRMGIRP